MDPRLPTAYPDEAPYDDPPRHRDRRLEIALIVVAAVVLIGAVLLFTRSPGPPTTPVGVQVEAMTCESPCRLVTPQITVAWTPPEAGADPTGYRLIRDGAPIEASLDASQLTFVDELVTLGETYAYQVVALSTEGDSAPTAPAEAVVPEPPREAANLGGVYRVELTVTKATSIGAAFGIENPIPGKHLTDRWSFSPAFCTDNEVTCASEWSGLEGAIVQSGGWWKGTVEGLPAQCDGERRARAPIDLRLQTIDVEVVDAAWVVFGFQGTASVSFQCPGFPPASATVRVAGSL